MNTLAEKAEISFINFHHNFHHSDEFINFLIKTRWSGWELRNLGIIPFGWLRIYYFLRHQKKYRLYKKIQNCFNKDGPQVFLSGIRYTKLKKLIPKNRDVEIMFHPGDKRRQYVEECAQF